MLPATNPIQIYSRPGNCQVDDSQQAIKITRAKADFSSPSYLPALNITVTPRNDWITKLPQEGLRSSFQHIFTSVGSLTAELSMLYVTSVTPYLLFSGAATPHPGETYFEGDAVFTRNVIMRTDDGENLVYGHTITSETLAETDFAFLPKLGGISIGTVVFKTPSSSTSQAIAPPTTRGEISYLLINKSYPLYQEAQEGLDRLKSGIILPEYLWARRSLFMLNSDETKFFVVTEVFLPTLMEKFAPPQIAAPPIAAASAA